ncbi:MAG TPA: heme exporter protein CcmB [Actinomycetota bacterium]|jgi:heme exporter protein B|nr:heme exporter protein CcmB [Actinomycetota bacterium]
MSLLRQALLVGSKDLRIELRGRHATGAAAPFVATVLLSFGLALGPGRSLLRQTAPGLLWLAVLFASTMAFRSSYRAETEDGAIDSLVLSPVDDAAVFLGKAAAVSVELLALEALVLALAAGLFDLSLVGQPLVLLAAVGLGTVGLSLVGSLFGIVAESSATGEGLLPLLVLPLATPVLLAGVRATAMATSGHGAEAGSWLGLLLAFDLCFAAVGVLAFGALMEER